MFDPIIGYANLGSFAGIGSRRVSHITSLKHAQFAFCMALFGYTNNTGGADGIDTSTEFGSKLAYDWLSDNFGLPKGEYQRVLNCFLPWAGFNGRGNGNEYIVPPKTNQIISIAQSHHPDWQYLGDGAKNMMCRNTCQVLGETLQKPVNFVMCHTPDGALDESQTSSKTGGTGQAIRIASRRNIKVFNTGNPQIDVLIDQKLENARHMILQHFGFDPLEYVEKKYNEFQPFKQVHKGDFVQAMLNKEYDILIHGCNCQNAMGSGFALRVKQEFNEAYQADLRTKKADRKKLGTFTYANLQRGDANFTVVNAYTQFRWGRQPILHSDYEAVRKSLRAINKAFPTGRILMPRIASGLSNGCWVTVSNIIATELKGRDITIVEKKEKELDLELNHASGKEIGSQQQLGFF
ncbi:hypothetical protein ACXHQ0_19055 [Vibrio antiquarius]|uniref:Uncharacterized protein n=1 Tax=Vibrio parahaemolyticus TaxID=670 RepID=A0A8H9N9R6_VIBPH|nr:MULTISPECIES: hypothetical protein [Vibrio harveyi group]MCS0114853.1 hypothetical protein [Vibrio parahaemolyticus]MCS0313576.1 hypothetical protein [Vibrio diabolicus]UYV30336.1 hypothetical protein M5598_25345 [Vibrio parahaemolyticus]UYW19654.1 hypothetical protein IF561_25310 [Vibrio parahaemolyticus]